VANYSNHDEYAVTRDPILLARVFFMLLATVVGCYIGIGVQKSIEYSIIAFSLAGIFVLIEHASNFVSSKGILFAATGAFLGLIFSSLIHPAIPPYVAQIIGIPSYSIPLISHLLFCYLGISLALRHVDRFSFSRLNFILSSPSDAEKVIDSSVLIDGRFLDVIDTSFLAGPFVVPEFVVRELQNLADSTVTVRRQRGRRALETLDILRERYGRIRLDDIDYKDMPVDEKLIKFTDEVNGMLLTTDYNLQKVAQIHKVRTLNLNELANILKPRTYVGEELVVYLDRRGKERNQAVGYLDDGTMVIVENGVEDLGTEIVTEITSILQSPSGRMVFAKKIRSKERGGGGQQAEQGELVQIRRTRDSNRMPAISGSSSMMHALPEDSDKTEPTKAEEENNTAALVQSDKGSSSSGRRPSSMKLKQFDESDDDSDPDIMKHASSGNTEDDEALAATAAASSESSAKKPRSKPRVKKRRRYKE
jgi:uncharacterized protein YacL